METTIQVKNELGPGDADRRSVGSPNFVFLYKRTMVMAACITSSLLPALNINHRQTMEQFMLERRAVLYCVWLNNNQRCSFRLHWHGLIGGPGLADLQKTKI